MMDLKYYICQGLDTGGDRYYSLTRGTEKTKIDTKTEYYTGRYMESGEAFRKQISQSQTLTFEGVYDKNSSLAEFFLIHYFGYSETERVSLFCEYFDGTCFYNEGHLEILEFESDPHELRIKGKIYFENTWSDYDISDFYVVEE